MNAKTRAMLVFLDGQSHKGSSSEKALEIESTCFEVQACRGVAKHLGGSRATERLAEACRIDQDRRTLVVGHGIYAGKKQSTGETSAK